MFFKKSKVWVAIFTAFLIGVVMVISAYLLYNIEDKLILKQGSFSEFQDWNNDLHLDALKAYIKTCDKLQKNNYKTWFSIQNYKFNFAKECETAYFIMSNKIDHAEAKKFFESNFIPFKVKNNWKTKGVFTGYYEIDLNGSRYKTSNYKYPIYSLPSVNYKISRKEINEGAFNNLGLEIAYTDDPIKLFFMHIQGSGRIITDNGEILRLGYAGKNGLPYYSIGKHFIEKHGVSKKEINAEFIINWLKLNKEEAEKIMNLNNSYVFFKQYFDENYPIGSAQVPLSAGRSIAIDPKYISFNLPIWLEVKHPGTKEIKSFNYNKLMIAQDSGGAIKGPIRGDIFFGNGDIAEKLAWYMNSKGSYWVLIPLTSFNN